MVLLWEDVKARYASAYGYGCMACPAPRFCAFEPECLRYALAPPGEYRAMLLGNVAAGSLAASLLLSDIGQWCYDANVWRGGLFFYERPAAKGLEHRFTTQALHGPVWPHDATVTI